MKIFKTDLERFHPAKLIELSKSPADLEAAVIAERKKKAIEEPKDANYYAYELTTPIPDWLETEIMALDADNIAYLAIDLGWALLLGKWNAAKNAEVEISDQAFDWLYTQDRDTFKALLQWVAMELI